jgi:pimeloyl-ACP methyl ester carboxylesterase
MPSVSVNGINLFYDEQNPNDLEDTVVFLHGAGGNHMSWWQQVPTFREQYRCISVDQRGFGRSLDPSGEEVARFTDDLEALLDELDIERAALVAQSMGGRSALGFAVRSPERVRALVMADTWGFFDWPELQARVTELREAQSNPNAPLTDRALGSDFQVNNPAGTFLYRQIFDLNPPRAPQQPLTEGAPSKADVEGLAVPSMFLVGSEDALTPPEILRAVHKIVPGSKFVEVPGCGHSVYFEQPDTFNEIVGGFLADQFGAA